MYIKVKIRAGAKEETIKKIRHDFYEISVKEKAERNNANKRILDIIRNIFSCKNVRIVSGHHSPSKIINVENEE